MANSSSSSEEVEEVEIGGPITKSCGEGEKQSDEQGGCERSERREAKSEATSGSLLVMWVGGLLLLLSLRSSPPSSDLTSTSLVVKP